MEETQQPNIEATGEARKHWYIVHTYSGFEKKVKESLEGRVAAYGLTDKIGQIVIPTESVVEVRGGKKVISSRMCSAWRTAA